MTNRSDMHDAETSLNAVYQGASHCPSCGDLGEFDLPAESGTFQIACFACEHIYEIDATHAIASSDSSSDSAAETAPDTTSEEDAQPLTIQCLDCGGAIELSDNLDDDADIQCPHCMSDDDNTDSDSDDVTSRFTTPALDDYKSIRTRKTGIVLVSILSAGLVIAAGILALGLYFLTLRTDSDITRYIETTILQLAPAEFTVEQAAYEISDTDLGTSLLVTITLSNSGDVEGAPAEMKVVLTDADNNQLVSWPLDTAGQIIAPGQSAQLYTRLFEPPADFTNLQVFVR